MAIRSSATRRIPGNPLAGLMQQTARKARSTSRRSSVPGPEGPAGPPGPPGPATGTTVSATVLVADATGVATWEFPPQQGRPVVVATPYDSLPALVVVSEVTESSATFIAYQVDGEPAPFQGIAAVAFTRPDYTDPQPPANEGTP